MFPAVRETGAAIVRPTWAILWDPTAKNKQTKVKVADHLGWITTAWTHTLRGNTAFHHLPHHQIWTKTWKPTYNCVMVTIIHQPGRIRINWEMEPPGTPVWNGLDVLSWSEKTDLTLGGAVLCCEDPIVYKTKKSRKYHAFITLCSLVQQCDVTSCLKLLLPHNSPALMSYIPLKNESEKIFSFLSCFS